MNATEQTTLNEAIQDARDWKREAQRMRAALAAGKSPCWVHNAAHTQEIEDLRRIALAHADWWNRIALPALGPT
jgi:hypothetical protein